MCTSILNCISPLQKIHFPFLHCRIAERRRQRHRQHNYIIDIVGSFRLDEFKTFFRISRTSFQYSYELICALCQERSIRGILCREGSGGSPQKPLQDRLLVMLWYLSSQDRYSSVADRFGICESTANTAIRNLMLFTKEYLVERLITWPSNHEQLEIGGIYEETKNFPGIRGFIDGSHIAIRKPEIRGFDYYNRKDFYFVILQAVCREDLRFTDIYVGWPGKVHDARVFRNSPLYADGHVKCGGGHILADSAYPNIDWVLTPFRDNGQLTPSQTCFNIVHSSARSAIERAFGLLKGRFTRLKFVDQRNIPTILDTICTACVLHYNCILNEDDFLDIVCEDAIDAPIPDHGYFPDAAITNGAVKRIAIARRLLQNQWWMNIIRWRHGMETLPTSLPLCVWNSLETRGFPTPRVSIFKILCFLCCLPEQDVKQNDQFSVISDAMMFVLRHCNMAIVQSICFACRWNIVIDITVLHYSNGTTFHINVCYNDGGLYM